MIPILLILTTGAAVSDCLMSRITNAWLCAGLLTGAGLLILEAPGELPGRLLTALLVLVLLLPAYLIGSLGAGDVKLLAAVAFLLNRRQLIPCVLISFALGALLGLPACIRDRTLKRSVHFALPVFLSVLLTLAGSAMEIG
ncbi:MAG: prepilin peptidase [Butyrivibrio sp.]|nr:prepilin peptidase [Butyrivibrio sp.]